MSLPVLYTVEEAAAYLHWSPETLKTKVSKNEVPHTRLNGNWGVRFTEADLLEIIDRGRRPALEQRRPGRRRSRL